MRNFQKEIKEVKEDFKKYIKDNTISLEDRWKILTKNTELGETSWRTNFGLDRDDSFLYDDEGPCYMEKYQTSEVKEILEMMLDDEDFNLTSEEEIKFKQFCVDGCYSKMKFDW